ncbi:MAG: hypothetical protein K2X47_16945 [Bdellovibrionales bacterium]|nr:hypothetical protein [Bdellovibrionales bacterium]
MSRPVNEPSSFSSLVPDFRAGLLVSLLALPLSLGIALAGGFPAVAGLLTAITAGLIASWFKGAPLTIKGPAAGLIAIVLGSVTELGQGDMLLGYKRTLAVGVAASVLQIVIALFRGATLGTLVPKSVVHGMLAAIGVIILSKQIHVFLGVPAIAKEPVGLLMEVPHSISLMNPMIAILGLIVLVVVLSQKYWGRGFMKLIPAPLLALAIIVPLGVYLNLHDDHGYDLFDHHYASGHKFDVQVPHSLLNALNFPDFSALSDVHAWKWVLMLAIIGSIESTLTVLAIDKIAKVKKRADVNRDLLSIGVANLIASFVGGLPMISEVVRSRANLDAGAKSHWSNATMGLCLLLMVTLGYSVLELIPLSALAALLLITGARLASWKHLQEASHIGWDQALYFLTTLIVTLMTDLLLGVIAGIGMKILVHLIQGIKLPELFSFDIASLSQVNENGGLVPSVKLKGALVFFKVPKVEAAIMNALKDYPSFKIDIRDVKLIDHTTMDRLHEIVEEYPQLQIVGEENTNPLSSHKLATRRVTG